jgi:addiction module HigA family antidote
MNRMRAIHPGEILGEEFLKPLGMSANALAHAIGVPANRVSGIVGGKRSVTADSALRLSRAFGTTPEFWLNLQAAHDLRVAEQQGGKALRAVKRVA